MKLTKTVLPLQSYITFELFERVKNERKEFSIRIALSEGAHSLPLDASLDAKHALSVQPRHVLTNHLPLQNAYDTLHQWAESSLYKKSSTTFEGMLPVEGKLRSGSHRVLERPLNFPSTNFARCAGDELFSGRKHELVQIIDLNFHRARPKSVSSQRGDGTASETGSVTGASLA